MGHVIQYNFLQEIHIFHSAVYREEKKRKEKRESCN